MADRSSKERRLREEWRMRRLSKIADSDGARAYQVYESCQVQHVPRRRCAADLLRAKYLREQRNARR